MQFDAFEAYKIAIDTRNLEIKLFWQRSLFFAAFISAVFVGYASKEVEPLMKLTLAVFGLIFSLAWSVANRGSKYWYESWESKIDQLEDIIGTNLFKNWQRPQHKFFLYQGRLYSVSKITIFLSDTILLGWLFLFANELNNFFKILSDASSCKCLAAFMIIIFVAIEFVLLFWGTRTNVPEDVKAQWR